MCGPPIENALRLINPRHALENGTLDLQQWDAVLIVLVIFYGYTMQPHTIFHILDTYCPPLGSLELDETMPTTCVHDDLVYGVYRWLVRVACARVFHSCMCAQIGRDCIHSSWFDRTIGVHEERDFAWWHKSYL
jgi:hypothetical protein